MEAFIKKEPAAARWLRPWYGSQEFISQEPRCCLWLRCCPPNGLRKMPQCLKRVEAVREMRQMSKSEGTRKLADTPTRFHVENMPSSDFIAIPKVSTDKRRYIPMGFMAPDVLRSDLALIVPDATLYHFGVLASNVHMAWTRSVCGRLGMGYRYSRGIAYNNFPWPQATEGQRAQIEETARGILGARALYAESSLADLYDEAAMPPELRKAHQANDRAVMQAYGLGAKMTEAERAGELMGRYGELALGARAEQG